MTEFVAAFFVAVLEVVLVMIAALVAGVVWCLVVGAAAIFHLGVASARSGRDLLRRRSHEREMILVVVEYQRAAADIRSISQAARREIGRLAGQGRAS
jgi:hypothetical protein